MQATPLIAQPIDVAIQVGWMQSVEFFIGVINMLARNLGVTFLCTLR